MLKKWTDEETKKFMELYPTVPTEELVIIFQRNKSALTTRACKLGIKKTIRADGLKYVYEEEEKNIIEYSKTHSIPETEKYFNRDFAIIKNILVKNNIKIIPSSHWWTKDEEQFLVENFYKESPEYISNFLGKRWKTITKKARDMGMNRMDKKGNFRKASVPLSLNEETFIKNNCGTIGLWEISKKLGRSLNVVSSFCKEHNLDFIKLRKHPDDYSDDLLLEELRRRSIVLGRCPTSGEIQRDLTLPSIDIYYDRFGSFSKACELAGLETNIGYYGTLCYSKNGDKCYSSSEQIITNYLIDHNVFYIKEYEYYNIIPDIESDIVMDWYIDGVVVEYFGMQKFERYELKTEMKQKICKENNIKIISIFPEEIKYLDKIFCEFINKNP